MSKRSRLMTGIICVFFLLIFGIGWDLVCIFLNLKTGSNIQESLLVSLRERYPDHSFEKFALGKGHEPGIPSFGIKILSHLDHQERIEMLCFVETKIQKCQSGVSLILYFGVENKQFQLNKSRNMKMEWIEE